jgi:hypothetical protein
MLRPPYREDRAPITHYVGIPRVLSLATISNLSSVSPSMLLLSEGQAGNFLQNNALLRFTAAKSFSLRPLPFTFTECSVIHLFLCLWSITRRDHSCKKLESEERYFGHSCELRTTGVRSSATTQIVTTGLCLRFT